MKLKDAPILGLSLFLAVSVAANAYLGIDLIVTRSYEKDAAVIYGRYFDGYERLACDLVCGKTIADANVLLAPSEVVRFKQRTDFGHLYIGGYQSGATTMEVCLDGDVITAIEANPIFGQKADCVAAAYLPSQAESAEEDPDE